MTLTCNWDDCDGATGLLRAMEEKDVVRERYECEFGHCFTVEIPI